MTGKTYIMKDGFPYGSKRNHYIDKDAYYYIDSKPRFLYWHMDTQGDILTAPNNDEMP